MDQILRARWALTAGLLLASAAPGETVVRRWGRAPQGPPAARKAAPRRTPPPTGYVVETRSAPVIDGKPDEKAWSAAPPLALARTLDGSAAAPQPTEVRLLHDGKTLYLAFRCVEPRTAKLTANRRGHDVDVWEDDSLEFFLGSGGTYYHFGVSAAGGTRDGRVKDKSWSSGMTAATAVGAGQWTAEVAIPLAKIAGAGKPAELIANFNRTRRVTGTAQESAWSPTYSGDSHVPARFGKLLFRAPPKPAGPAAPAAPAVAVSAGAVKVLPTDAGVGVVRVDLSDLPKGAKIRSAELLVFRAAPLSGADDDARVDIEISPGPRAAGRSLTLIAPWFDRFDATEAVRKASGKVEFFIESAPRLDLAATCLDVAYEGTPKNVAPQVSGVRASHRAGQTFITWKEIDDPVGRDTIQWGEMKGILANLDRRRRVRYCVYRAPKPITAANLHEATRIAVAKPLSGWNVNGRNIERPIDTFIATQPVLNFHQGNPFGRATVDGPYGVDCPIDRLVIADGGKPLPRGTGLYVHTPGKAGKAHYAVVTSVDGAANTRDFSAANAPPKPVAEVAGAGEPVLQGELPPGHFWRYPQRRLHYVRWVAPPMANLPGGYFNWSVGVPSDLGKGAPLELNLHRDGGSYWRTQYRVERDSIVLSPHDFPRQTWWYGHHEALGTLRSFRQGRVHNYTERRLLAFVDWAAKKWGANRNRVLVTGVRFSGGFGALHLGIRHPDVFSLVLAGHPIPDARYAATAVNQARWSRGRFDSMQAAWGRIDWGLKTDGGENVWDALDLNRRVDALPAAAELPMVAMTSNKAWTPCHEFYRRMLKKGHAIVGHFWWGGTKLVAVSETSLWPGALRLSVRRNRPLIAFKGGGADKLLGGKGQGAFNFPYGWEPGSVVDKPERFEVTLTFYQIRGGSSEPAVADVTIRRRQKFTPPAGTTCRWSAGKQNGEVTIVEGGALTIPRVDLSTAGTRLVVTVK